MIRKDEYLFLEHILMLPSAAQMLSRLLLESFDTISMRGCHHLRSIFLKSSKKDGAVKSLLRGHQNASWQRANQQKVV